MSGAARTGSYFDDDERAAVAAALERQVPGCVQLGAVDYVEGLLCALDFDPPHVWAAPAGSGQAWLRLGAWEHHAWSQRIAGWKTTYARVAAGEATADDERTVFEHACEATYGDPAYGGNRHSGGWAAIGFAEPMFPPERSIR